MNQYKTTRELITSRILKQINEFHEQRMALPTHILLSKAEWDELHEWFENEMQKPMCPIVINTENGERQTQIYGVTVAMCPGHKMMCFADL